MNRINWKKIRYGVLYLVLWRLEQPFLWLICLAAVLKFDTPCAGIRQSAKNVCYGAAFATAVVCISMEILDGAFFDGFMPSPYDRSIGGICGNLYAVFPPLLMREYIRGKMLEGVLGWRKKWSVLFLTLLFFVLCGLNYSKLSTLQGMETTSVYLFEQILPFVIESTLLTYLAAYGGWQTASVYVLLLTAFEWFFPILPSPNWLAKAVIRLAIPGIALFILSDYVEQESGKRRTMSKKQEYGAIATMGVCVLFVWFFAGVFSVYPSVVLTGSMEPLIYPGDLVLIEKIREEDELYALEVGDIINFDRDEINISHRIIDIKEDEAGNRLLQTKGDNNSSEDVRLVKLEEVRGRIIFDVKKAGLVVLWLKGSSQQVEELVEF